MIMKLYNVAVLKCVNIVIHYNYQHGTEKIEFDNPHKLGVLTINILKDLIVHSKMVATCNHLLKKQAC